MLTFSTIITALVKCFLFVVCLMSFFGVFGERATESKKCYTQSLCVCIIGLIVLLIVGR